MGRGTKIAEAKDGSFSIIVGQVRRIRALMQAKLSGRPCVYQRIAVLTGHDPEHPEVEEWGGTATAHDFLVEDDTGVAIVRMEVSQCALVIDRYDREERGADVGTRREIVIMEGDEVKIVGECRLEEQSSGPYRSNVGAPRIRIERSGGRTLLIMVKPRRATGWPEA